MTVLFKCVEGKSVEVLCLPCAQAAGYDAPFLTAWTDRDVLNSVNADADGPTTCGPTSCQRCGEGEPGPDPGPTWVRP